MKGEVFHILNRGVEKRKVFLSNEDYLRFILNLRDFNNKNNVSFSYFNRQRLFGGATSEHSEQSERVKQLVDVLCWVEMPNHPHVIVQEKIDDGVSKFSQKIFGGYTMYFNQKHKRGGVLFQGRSKIISVTRDPHFFYLPFYLFSNPIKLIEPQWKEKGIKNLDKVIRFLENYKYSAFLDLIGKENFPFIINKTLFYELFDTNPKRLKKNFYEWLKAFKK